SLSRRSLCSRVSTSSIPPLSLHDALPIFLYQPSIRPNDFPQYAFNKEQMMPNTVRLHRVLRATPERVYRAFLDADALAKWMPPKDRKSTRLNSSHQIISYAVFCLKKNRTP